MGKVDFKLNWTGVGKLLKSKEIMDICREHANVIKARAGDGYEVTTYEGPLRVRASVAAITEEAKRDNAENNTLLKAVRR